MKKLVVVVLALLVVAVPAEAKTRPLTHRQARAALLAAANDVARHGETVLAGGCSRYRRTRADCALHLERGDGACSLSVLIVKRGKRLFYGLDYATDRDHHMRAACVRP